MLIGITKEVREKLESEKQRTAMTPAALFKHCDLTPPDGLKAHSVNAWMRGKTKHAKSEHINYVLAAYAEVPDEGIKLKLTPERVSALENELKRTSKTVGSVLLHAPKPLPKGLTEAMISRILTGKAMTVKQDQWMCLMDTLEQLPSVDA